MELICKLQHACQICLSSYVQTNYISRPLSHKHLLDVRFTTLLALSDTVGRRFSLQGEFRDDGSGHHRKMSECELTL
jgi:hypothetical protein